MNSSFLGTSSFESRTRIPLSSKETVTSCRFFERVPSKFNRSCKTMRSPCDCTSIRARQLPLSSSSRSSPGLSKAKIKKRTKERWRTLECKQERQFWRCGLFHVNATPANAALAPNLHLIATKHDAGAGRLGKAVARRLDEIVEKKVRKRGHRLFQQLLRQKIVIDVVAPFLIKLFSTCQRNQFTHMPFKILRKQQTKNNLILTSFPRTSLEQAIMGTLQASQSRSNFEKKN